MTSTELQIVEKAYELISDPSHWTTNWLAKDKLGYNIPPEDPGATCWCSIGALQRSVCDLYGTAWYGQSNSPEASTYNKIIDLFDKVINNEFVAEQDPIDFPWGTSIGDFNDNYGHEKVKALFQRVMDLIREEVSAE